MSDKSLKSLIGGRFSAPTADIPAQLEDTDLEAAGDGSKERGFGVVSKHPQPGVFVEDSKGVPHGICYGAFRSRLTGDTGFTWLSIVFEQADGDWELNISGEKLRTLARELTLQRVMTLHVGGPVSAIEVQQREKKGY